MAWRGLESEEMLDEDEMGPMRCMWFTITIFGSTGV